MAVDINPVMDALANFAINERNRSERNYEFETQRDFQRKQFEQHNYEFETQRDFQRKQLEQRNNEFETQRDFQREQFEQRNNEFETQRDFQREQFEQSQLNADRYYNLQKEYQNRSARKGKEAEFNADFLGGLLSDIDNAVDSVKLVSDGKRIGVTGGDNPDWLDSKTKEYYWKEYQLNAKKEGIKANRMNFEQAWDGAVMKQSADIAKRVYDIKSMHPDLDDSLLNEAITTTGLGEKIMQGMQLENPILASGYTPTFGGNQAESPNYLRPIAGVASLGYGIKAARGLENAGRIKSAATIFGAGPHAANKAVVKGLTWGTKKAVGKTMAKKLGAKTAIKLLGKFVLGGTLSATGLGSAVGIALTAATAKDIYDIIQYIEEN